MISAYDQFVHAVETFYIPIEDPSCPGDWKEWYHYILFDPSGAASVLFNICFSGVPEKGNITVTVLVTLQKDNDGRQTYGYCQILPWERGSVQKNPFRVELPELIFSQHHRVASVTVNREAARIFLQMEAKPLATPIVAPVSNTSEDEFIGWGLLPGMEISGKLRLGKTEMRLDKKWYCYHDHNYGRFRWGGNVGWLWWVAIMPAESHHPILTYVFHQGNPAAPNNSSTPYLFVYENHQLIKVFSGNSLTVNIQWSKQGKHPVRLPGVLTPLFADRPITMPEYIEVTGGDDADEITLKMSVLSHAEIILPDDRERKYTFLKEVNGKTEAYHRINGNAIKSTGGQFYAEYAS